MLAIFSELVFKSAAVYLHRKTFFRQPFSLLSISSLVNNGIYRQSEVNGLANVQRKSSVINISRQIFSEECYFTVPLCVTLLHYLLKIQLR